MATSNPLADLLGLSEEESKRIFDKAVADSDPPEVELAPETRVVVLRFPTDAQKDKAIASIRETGTLRVRIPVD